MSGAESMKSPWSPLDSEEFKTLDDMRRAKGALKELRGDMNKAGKELVFTHEADGDGEHLAFTLIEGELQALHTRAANLVQRANGRLLQEGCSARLLYESADNGVLVRIEEAS